MRVIVTGSRQWSDKPAILRRLAQLPIGAVIVHGDAAGADSMAGWAAFELSLKVERHPADWKTHGKAAGSIRNQVMVNAGADLCIAFPLPHSRGTWDMVRRARAAGIPVEIFGMTDYETA